MTVEEKNKKLEGYCIDRGYCTDCPLLDTYDLCYGPDATPEVIDRNYERVFGDDKTAPAEDPVNRPSHYTDGKIEVIDYIEDKKLGFCLGNAVKYISRAGKKDPSKEIEDLKKAKWYIERRIKELEEGIA